MKKIFITGSAGFIGYHLSKLLLEKGFYVHGYDALTTFYDVKLKLDRNLILKSFSNYSFTSGKLENANILNSIMTEFKPDAVIHLAAQAGVRHSIEYPMDYIQSNIIGTFNVIEASRKNNIQHLLIASTSSVYGDSITMPYQENHKSDNQLSIYAATKKSTESISHAYSHIWELPITAFRFFTVYGPWGRPDMVPFKFVDLTMAGKAIDIYNYGDMYRDFTYVEDLVEAIYLLMDVIPNKKSYNENSNLDTLSSSANYRTVNIGNSEKIRLEDFINEIEIALDRKIEKNYIDMQTGDVKATWADSRLLKSLTSYVPKTNYKVGIYEFIKWYKDYYKLEA